MSQDPLGLVAGFNMYTFAPNVQKWIDPLGLCKKKPKPITDPSRLLPAPRGTDPWMPNTPIKSNPVPKGGIEVDMAVSSGQTKPGGWATGDTIPDVNFVRNDLVVISSFKEEVSGVQRLLVPEGVQVQEGIVGPQFEKGITYPGGANQVQILNYGDRSHLKPIGAVRPIHLLKGKIMNMISSFKELFKDQNYDRVNNPQLLSVSELQPIGIEWYVGNKQYQICFKGYASVVPLADMSGIAIAEFSNSDLSKGGNAYIINADGSKRFDIQLPSEYANGRFSDVYYIGECLFFFFFDREDFRVLVDVNTGEVKNINISR